MTPGDAVVLLIVAALAALALYGMYRDRRSGKGCSCGGKCGCCSGSCEQANLIQIQDGRKD